MRPSFNLFPPRLIQALPFRHRVPTPAKDACESVAPARQSVPGALSPLEARLPRHRQPAREAAPNLESTPLVRAGLTPPIPPSRPGVDDTPAARATPAFLKPLPPGVVVTDRKVRFQLSAEHEVLCAVRRLTLSAQFAVDAARNDVAVVETKLRQAEAAHAEAAENIRRARTEFSDARNASLALSEAIDDQYSDENAARFDQASEREDSAMQALMDEHDKLGAAWTRLDHCTWVHATTRRTLQKTIETRRLLAQLVDKTNRMVDRTCAAAERAQTGLDDMIALRRAQGGNQPDRPHPGRQADRNAGKLTGAISDIADCVRHAERSAAGRLPTLTNLREIVALEVDEPDVRAAALHYLDLQIAQAKAHAMAARTSQNATIRLRDESIPPSAAPSFTQPTRLPSPGSPATRGRFPGRDVDADTVGTTRLQTVDRETDSPTASSSAPGAVPTMPRQKPDCVGLPPIGVDDDKEVAAMHADAMRAVTWLKTTSLPEDDDVRSQTTSAPSPITAISPVTKAPRRRKRDFFPRLLSRLPAPGSAK